jgi:hypothetical protein
LIKRNAPTRQSREGFRHLRVEFFLVLFILVTALVSVFPNGVDSVHLGAKLSDSPQELFEIFGLSDSGSYMRAALELQNLGGLTPDKYWVIGLWPPGMVILNAALIQVFGDGFGVAYGLLTVTVWTALLSAFGIKILRRFGSIAAFASSALVLASGPMQIWIFDSGLFYAEGFSTAANLSGLILLINSSRSLDRKAMISYGIFAGICFAVAAYFRSSFSLIEPALLLLTVIFSILFLLSRYSSKLRGSKSILSSSSISLGSAWITMFLLMEPWLRFTELAIRPGERYWSAVSGNFFRGAWTQRSEMPDFLAFGGVGWACEIDPVFCEEVRVYEGSTGQLLDIGTISAMTVQTALLNLDKYLLDRWDFISTGWFSTEASMGNPGILWGSFFLFGLAVVLVLVVRETLGRNFVVASSLFLSVIIVLPLFVGHIEPRYFIPLKMLVILIPWILSPRNTHDLKNSSTLQ